MQPCDICLGLLISVCIFSHDSPHPVKEFWIMPKSNRYLRHDHHWSLTEIWIRSVQLFTKTRQSEMANTSPTTCQCLATFTPLKSKMLIFFSWRHFSARSSCYIINWYGYPRGSHEKYLKKIVSPVFEIRYWIVTC